MLEPGHWTAVVVAAIGSLAGLTAYLGARGKTRTDYKTALDKRIDERVEKQLGVAWQTIDTQGERIAALGATVTAMKEADERKMSAVARIFRAIAAQWPTPDGPHLDPLDIAEIEDTIPAQWLRTPRG